MKALLLFATCLALSSCIVIAPWRLQEINSDDDSLILGITTSLNKLNTDTKLTYTKQNITEIHMHLTQIVAGIMHRVTFRADTSEGPKIIQLKYLEQMWLNDTDKYQPVEYTVQNTQAGRNPE